MVNYVKKCQYQKKYISDLTDEQWAAVAPRLPAAKSRPCGGRPRHGDLRAGLKTIRSLHRSGCPGEMLPHALLPKSTADDYGSQWRDEGIWTNIVTA